MLDSYLIMMHGKAWSVKKERVEEVISFLDTVASRVGYIDVDEYYKEEEE